MEKETVEEYLARGGKITHLKDDDREIRAQQQWTFSARNSSGGSSPNAFTTHSVSIRDWVQYQK
tara:strand:+ start:23 stop:214 length:192 start_codon:yes stop_codon:yes gene_type:complete